MPVGSTNFSAVDSFAAAQAAQNGNNSTAKASGNSNISMDSFLQLLAAQMKNQDMMNPMKDTEFMGQMAQFTTLQVMQDMSKTVAITNEISGTQYAIGLVGKEVIAATVDEEGEIKKTTGVVSGVDFYYGQPVFYIGEEGFYLSQLMSVGKVPEQKPPEGEDDDKIDNTLPGENDDIIDNTLPDITNP